VDGVWTPFHEPSLSLFFFLGHGLSFFFFYFLFFNHAFFEHVFYIFLHSPCLFLMMITMERVAIEQHGVLFCGRMDEVLAIF
jgi:hypothetical protein